MFRVADPNTGEKSWQIVVYLPEFAQFFIKIDPYISYMCGTFSYRSAVPFLR